MTKKAGKKFEDIIKKCANDVNNVYYYRLKDSASSFQKSDNLRFTPSNDYDCIMYKLPNLFPLELKTTENGTSFSFQRSKKDGTKMIKYTQIQGLTKASITDGVYAGFLFSFLAKAHTYWMNIQDFNKFVASTDKKSINEKDMIAFGAVLVDQRLKKVNYSYNIAKLIKDIKYKGEINV